MASKGETGHRGEEEIATQFPEIDQLLASEDFNRINKSFMTAYDALEKMSKERGGIGKSSRSQEAKKAMKAIERVMDLFRYLLRLKYEVSSGEGGGDSPPRGKK